MRTWRGGVSKMRARECKGEGESKKAEKLRAYLMYGPKNGPENNTFSCVPFCLRSHGNFERCDCVFFNAHSLSRSSVNDHNPGNDCMIQLGYKTPFFLSLHRQYLHCTDAEGHFNGLFKWIASDTTW